MKDRRLADNVHPLADATPTRSARLIEALPIGVLVLEPDGRISRVNGAAAQILGRREEWLIGRRLDDPSFALRMGEDPPPAVRNFPFTHLVRRGRSLDGLRLSVVRPDGFRVELEVHTAPLLDEHDGQEGVAVTLRDVTDRATIERERHHERAVLGEIFTHAPVGIAVLRGEPLRFALANRPFAAFTGRRAGALVGRTVEEALPEVAERVSPVLARVVSECRFHEANDVRFRIERDGRPDDAWFSYSYTPLRDDHADVTGVLVLARETTSEVVARRQINAERRRLRRALAERKQAEEALRRLSASLDQRVRERTAALEEANREMEAFTYSVSHDLRGPLQSMDGFSKALIEDYGDALDTLALGYLDRIRANAQRMAQLIDDLLSLSRVGRAELVKEDVDLSALAEAVAEETRARHPERRVEVGIAPGVRARGDRRLLRIVLENVFGNAWKFTAERNPGHIEFGSEDSAHGTTFFVRDDGAGFDMTYAEKLFAPFQRLHSEDEFPGTGIGAAIVHRIIRRHGGNVWAEGRPGDGATFRFTLPDDALAANVPVAHESERSPG